MTSQPCKVATPDGPTNVCGRDKVAGSNKFCYWHRLARSIMTEQVRAASARGDHVAHALRIARVPEKEWPVGERWCAGCQSFAPLWYCKDSQCKACAHRAIARSRDLSIYGLGHDAKDALIKLQGGKCAGCRRRQISKDLATDHNHATGEVRGLLCQTCNQKILGGAYDSLQTLLNLAYYLLRPPARSGSGWRPPEDLNFRFTWEEREG